MGAAPLWPARERKPCQEAGKGPLCARPAQINGKVLAQQMLPRPGTVTLTLARVGQP